MELNEAKNVYERFNNGETDIKCKVTSSLAQGIGVIIGVELRRNKDSDYYDFMVKFDNSFIHETAHYVVDLIKIKLLKCPKCKSVNISRIETHGNVEVFTQQENGKWENNHFHDCVEDDTDPVEKYYICDDCENEF